MAVKNETEPEIHGESCRSYGVPDAGADASARLVPCRYTRGKSRNALCAARWNRRPSRLIKCIEPFLHILSAIVDNVLRARDHVAHENDLQHTGPEDERWGVRDDKLSCWRGVSVCGVVAS